MPLNTSRLPSGEMTALFRATFSGRRMFVRNTRRLGAGAGRPRQTPQPAATANAATTIAQAMRSRLRRRTSPGAGAPAWDPASLIQRSSAATSWALCQRSSGSLARQVRTTRSSAGGARGARAESGGGSDPMIAEIRLAWLLPSNAFWPVTIS